MGNVSLKVDEWKSNKDKPTLEFRSDDMIFEIRYTKDNRLVIEQIGWVMKHELKRTDTDNNTLC